MEQQERYTLKKRIKMKQIFILFTIAYLTVSLHLNAQNCIDTVNVKGYYVIMRKATEIKSHMIRKENNTILELPIDNHNNRSFIPCDSITKNQPLSYWLNHFFDNTKQVFISCEKVAIKYFITKECLTDLKNNDTCSFPILKTRALYKTTDFNSGDVFEIYYIDAYWAKIKIKKGTIEETMIPSRIAETSISPDVSEYDLYYFIRYNKMKISPQIRDSHIKGWRK